MLLNTLFLFPFALGSKLLNKTMDEISPETLTEWYILAQNNLKIVQYKMEKYNNSVWHQKSQITLRKK